MTTTKTTWHINGRATSSREGSMYWLHSVHCTMTLTSTHYGFLTPQTLYKPLPPPLKYPYPWKGYGFALGKGKGRCEKTCRLPMPITRGLVQGGTGILKKDPVSIFFFPWTLRGLTNYVIRHQSKYSNMTSSSEAFPAFVEVLISLFTALPLFVVFTFLCF